LAYAAAKRRFVRWKLLAGLCLAAACVALADRAFIQKRTSYCCLETGLLKTKHSLEIGWPTQRFRLSTLPLLQRVKTRSTPLSRYLAGARPEPADADSWKWLQTTQRHLFASRRFATCSYPRIIGSDFNAVRANYAQVFSDIEFLNLTELLLDLYADTDHPKSAAVADRLWQYLYRQDPSPHTRPIVLATIKDLTGVNLAGIARDAAPRSTGHTPTACLPSTSR
jgi:hypothetical protein